MAFKCLRCFVMFKKGPQHHISVCMTVHSGSQMCKDHFTAGRECENHAHEARTMCTQESRLSATPCSLDHLFTVREVAIDVQTLRVRSEQRGPST